MGDVRKVRIPAPDITQRSTICSSLSSWFRLHNTVSAKSGKISFVFQRKDGNRIYLSRGKTMVEPAGIGASEADTQAWDRVRRPKRCRLATQPAFQRLVAKIAPGLVTRTNRGLAQAGISNAKHHADFPRNNLPEFVHSSPRGAQERTDGPSPITAHDAARAIRMHGRPAVRANRGWNLHPQPPLLRWLIRRFPVTGKGSGTRVRTIPTSRCCGTPVDPSIKSHSIRQCR